MRGVERKRNPCRGRDGETNRVRRRLCIVSPPCRAAEHIEGWLDCAGHLLWREDVPPCQTHRCRVMSHCVLEFCQKPASLFCSLPPSLSPSTSLCVSLLLFPLLLSPTLCLYFNLNFKLISVARARAPFHLKSGTDMIFRWGLDSHLWTHGMKWSLIRSDYTKQQQRAKFVKVTGRGRKVSACISVGRNAEQYDSG